MNQQKAETRHVFVAGAQLLRDGLPVDVVEQRQVFLPIPGCKRVK
jgi:hypothetical protein